MAGKFALDTSVIIDVFAGDDNISSFLYGLEETFVPSVALGEIYYSALLSSRVEESLAQIERFLPKQVVAVIDANTARIFGELKRNLRRLGRPILIMIFGLPPLPCSMTPASRLEIDISKESRGLQCLIPMGLISFFHR